MKELRSAQLAIRLTPSEQRKLRSIAAASQLTVTDVVRLLIDGAEGVLPPRVVAKTRHTTEQRTDHSTPANRGAIRLEAKSAAAAR